MEIIIVGDEPERSFCAVGVGHRRASAADQHLVMRVPRALDYVGDAATLRDHSILPRAQDP
jgi:hypothetical protein